MRDSSQEKYTTEELESFIDLICSNDTSNWDLAKCMDLELRVAAIDFYMSEGIMKAPWELSFDLILLWGGVITYLPFRLALITDSYNDNGIDQGFSKYIFLRGIGSSISIPSFYLTSLSSEELKEQLLMIRKHLAHYLL
jgi:hypothetical protein